MNRLTMYIPGTKAYRYPIWIGADLLSQPQAWLSEWLQEKIVVITDDNTKLRFGLNLIQALQKNNVDPLLLSFPAGEQSKHYSTKQDLEEQMLLHQCDRKTLLLALGGGVVGDLAGFIAATYLRGIAYIQIPTTLLAMVDSSIGGKTGINTAQGKNLIGACWQPQAVVADLNCLQHLPQKQLINGLIEAVKMFLTHDKASFYYTEDTLETLFTRESLSLKKLIHQAIKIKIDIVALDEKENKERMILNFGHTIGHAIEKVTNYSILHGYAVALGILVEAKISQLQGLLSAEEYKTIQAFFARLNISGQELKQFSTDALIQATQNDKKARTGQARYVLLEKIGKIYETPESIVHPISANIVKAAILAASEA